MKKGMFVTTLITTILILVATIGCKKEVNSKNPTDNKSRLVNLADNIPAEDAPSVSSYGFLIFQTMGNADRFLELVRQSTHAEVQDYLSAIGFASFGSTIYGHTSDSVTESESYNYIYDRYHIFQIDDVILKPIGESHTCSTNPWQFLITMMQNYLTSTTYQYLIEGTFDSGSMNKFATNSTNPNFELFDFVRNYPTGYEESTPNPCPSSNDPKKFWGWDSGSCVQGEDQFDALHNEWVHTYIHTDPSHYVFWIKDKKAK